MSYYIDAQPMTDAALLSSSLAEDPTPAWVADNYTVGTEVHVVATHRVYRDTVGGASAVSPATDTGRWKDMRPTNKWAPFDEYSTTMASTTAADIVYTFIGRFCNALHLRAFAGATIVVSIKDAPGGTVIYRYPGPVGSTAVARLKKPARGYWDYGYGDRRNRTVLSLFDLPIKSNAEITVTIGASPGQRRAVGMILRGKLRNLIGRGWGGTEQGATATPKTYTQRKDSGVGDGTYTIRVRGSSKDLRMTLAMERVHADACLDQLEELMSRPVAVIATRVPGFDGLSAFGFITRSPVSYRNQEASCELNVEGNP